MHQLRQYKFKSEDNEMEYLINVYKNKILKKRLSEF